MDYAQSITVDLPYDQAVPRVKEAFAAQGLGTLTETDVQAALKDKLGVDIERFVILGTCHPQLALDVTRDIGLLLPCNVVVREHGGGVLTLDAAIIANIPGLPDLEPIAVEANRRIQAALDAPATD